MGGEVTKMRKLWPALLAALVVVGCGRAETSPVPYSGSYKVFEAASTANEPMVSVIDSRSHSVDRSVPLGAIAPSWKHIYTATGSRMNDLDPQTGNVLHSTRLPGDFHLPLMTINGMPGGLSPNARWLVLQRFDDTPDGPPSATHLLLIDTTYARAMVPIDLTGYFEFDAVSNDGKRIFLIQYLTNAIYHVRFFDVGGGQLDPAIVFDKSEGDDAMTGVRLNGVASPDGQWLYSVYAREHGGAFIHALNLDSAVAFCLDLAGTGFATMTSTEMQWSLSLSTDGTHLYAANGALGVVSEVVNPPDGAPSLTRTVKLTPPTASASGVQQGFIQDAEAKEIGVGSSALSPDGQTFVITGDSGVMWLDTASLHVTRRALSGWKLWSLAVSPDGKLLYAVSSGGVIAELPMNGSGEATFNGAAGVPLALVRVEAATQAA
jgi:hypothetical protein